MNGKIHSFQSFGTVDGPGIRNVIFMQGCPLRCSCCHNPDTWDFNGGETVECDELVNKILRFRSYFGNEGGVTVSGGEPLMQADFIAELFEKLKINGINTVLDTSGCIWNDSINKLLNVTDLILLDYKYADEEAYYKYTKCHKLSVDLFLDKVQDKKIDTWIRRVIIPGLNNDRNSTLQLKELKENFSCVKKIELLPFKKICIEKYKNMGIKFPLENFPEPSKNDIEECYNIVIL